MADRNSRWVDPEFQGETGNTFQLTDNGNGSVQLLHTPTILNDPTPYNSSRMNNIEDAITDNTLRINNIEDIVAKLTSIIIGPPDYANIESSNRITVNNGTWTVDRNGYVKISANFSTAFDNVACFVYINDREICLWEQVAFMTEVLQVRKGDIIRINMSSTIYDGGCYFIPSIMI